MLFKKKCGELNLIIMQQAEIKNNIQDIRESQQAHAH